MKMQTTLYAPCDGNVEEMLVAPGDAVDAGDLLVRMRE
jgi:pyruvate carboxylase